METLLGVDWHAMFVPALGLIEVVLRGTIMYLALLGSFGSSDAGRPAILDRLTCWSSSSSRTRRRMP